MSIAEFEKEALALPVRQRARLAASLLGTLPPPEAEISDEEVLQRDEDLESGRVEEISHEEFVRQVPRQRAR